MNTNGTNNTIKINALSKNILLGLVVVAVLALLGWQFLGKGKTISRVDVEEKETVKIGAILPLSGGAAVFGKYNKEATLASLEILSKSLGVKYSLTIEDSKTSPKDAVNAYMKMRNMSSSPQILATELSSVAMSLFPSVASDNGLLIAVATAEKLRSETHSIQVYPSSQQIYECLSVFLDNNNFSGDVTVYYINDDFGQSVSDKLKSESNRFLLTPFDANVDVRSLIAKENNKFVVVVGYGPSFLAILRELQSLNTSQYIVASPEFAFPEFYNAVDTSKQNLYFMEFKDYEVLNEILSPKLGRSVHPLDFLVFGGYLASLSVATDLINEGEIISGQLLYSRIIGREFKYGQYAQNFDRHGTAVYSLIVAPASKLKGRINSGQE